MTESKVTPTWRPFESPRAVFGSAEAPKPPPPPPLISSEPLKPQTESTQ
jgi:hypothetical protein